MRAIVIVSCLLLAATPSFAQGEPAGSPYPQPPAVQQQPPPPQPMPMPYAQGGYQQAPYPHGYPSAHHPHGNIPLKDMPDFRSGKRRRLAGILVTTIGSGLGLVVTSMGLLFSTSCSMYGCQSEGSDGLVAGGLIGMGVSLAVGIPLWVSGQRKVTEARRCWTQHLASSLDIAPSSNGLRVASSWRF